VSCLLLFTASFFIDYLPGNLPGATTPERKRNFSVEELGLGNDYVSFTTALTWLRSFITDRKQQLFFNGDLSSTVSVLGPLLFLLYSADVPFIADLHELGVHCYADDEQIYVFDKAGQADRMVAKVSGCSEQIDS